LLNLVELLSRSLVTVLWLHAFFSQVSWRTEKKAQKICHVSARTAQDFLGLSPYTSQFTVVHEVCSADARIEAATYGYLAVETTTLFQSSGMHRKSRKERASPVWPWGVTHVHVPVQHGLSSARRRAKVGPAAISPSPWHAWSVPYEEPAWWLHVGPWERAHSTPPRLDMKDGDPRVPAAGTGRPPWVKHADGQTCLERAPRSTQTVILIPSCSKRGHVQSKFDTTWILNEDPAKNKDIYIVPVEHSCKLRMNSE